MTCPPSKDRRSRSLAEKHPIRVDHRLIVKARAADDFQKDSRTFPGRGGLCFNWRSGVKLCGCRSVFTTDCLSVRPGPAGVVVGCSSAVIMCGSKETKRFCGRPFIYLTVCCTKLFLRFTVAVLSVQDLHAAEGSGREIYQNLVAVMILVVIVFVRVVSRVVHTIN